LSVTSQKDVDENIPRKASVTSERGSEGLRASMMNALSQIKDFEEFAAVSSRSEKLAK